MSVGSAGAGANKQIRYSVIIDTALAESKLRTLGINLKTTFESATPSVTKLGTGIQDVGNKMATTSAKSNTFTGALKTFDTTTKSTSGSVSILSNDFDKLATGGLTKTNTLAGQTTGSLDKLEKQTGKTSSRVDKLKEGFAGNRGLIYSMGTIFGTITGVVAEFQLLDDAQAQVAEATAKLTQLEKDGQKGTAAYTQAMQQKEKAERFASFTTRNLALAVSNFVPEILLLTTTLAKGGGAVSKFGGLLGKLKGAFGFGTAATAAGWSINYCWCRRYCCWCRNGSRSSRCKIIISSIGYYSRTVTSSYRWYITSNSSNTTVREIIRRFCQIRSKSNSCY